MAHGCSLNALLGLLVMQLAVSSILSFSQRSHLCVKEGRLLPNPEDCTSYFVCLRETSSKRLVLVSKNCRQGYVYAAELGACVWENTVETRCSKHDALDNNPQPNLIDTKYFSPVPNNGIEFESCRKSGAGCDGCSRPIFCDTRPDGTLHLVNSSECSEGLYCDSGTGECKVDVPGCNSVRIQFKCADAGHFPDPHLCSVYHMCIPTAVPGRFVQQDFSCRESGFSSVTATCRYPLSSPKCQEVLRLPCPYEGYSGVYPGDCNIYYTCVRSDLGFDVLTPLLKRCPAGSVFESRLRACIARTLTTSCPASNVFPMSRARCEQPGFTRDRFDCSRFFSCLPVPGNSGNLKGQVLNCPNGLHFNTFTSLCEESTGSKECEINPGESLPICFTPGIFPDVQNCRAFTVCSCEGTLCVPERHVCPLGHRFESRFGKCVPGSCDTSRRPEKDFKCTSAGKFHNPRNCGGYYFCVPDGRGGFVISTHFCPRYTLYSTILGFCIPRTHYANCNKKNLS